MSSKRRALPLTSACTTLVGGLHPSPRQFNGSLTLSLLEWSACGGEASDVAVDRTTYPSDEGARSSGSLAPAVAVPFSAGPAQPGDALEVQFPGAGAAWRRYRRAYALTKVFTSGFFVVHKLCPRWLLPLLEGLFGWAFRFAEE